VNDDPHACHSIAVWEQVEAALAATLNPGLEADMTRWDGYPPDPTRGAWHWLRQADLTPAWWNPDQQQWEQGGLACGGSITPKMVSSDHFRPLVEYVGPCVMPD